MKYTTQHHLKPSNLTNISNQQIDNHWKLYEGYVKNVNILLEELHANIQQNKHDSLLHVDRRRRLGFEYNGMVLHEYYFGNLKSSISIPSDSTVITTLETSFGSFDNWYKDFVTTAATRGIGWAITYLDPCLKNICINTFITDHEYGHIASFQPLLVLDVWEHAYMIDHSATERKKYIEAFIKNINWNVIEQRCKAAHSKQIYSRV